MQLQVPTNQAANFIAVVEALNRFEGAKYEQATQHDKNRQQAKRKRSGKLIKHPI